MAYVKYKELTKYFNFNKAIDICKLPKYVLDYIDENDKILYAYKTSRDKGIFTERRMVLFDVKPIINSKKIHIIPYSSISSGAILFGKRTTSMFFSFDSGYQMKLNFVNVTPTDKTNLRKLYTYILNRK